VAKKRDKKSGSVKPARRNGVRDGSTENLVRQTGDRETRNASAPVRRIEVRNSARLDSTLARQNEDRDTYLENTNLARQNEDRDTYLENTNLARQNEDRDPQNANYDYDVIFFDTVGNAFTRESLKTKPSGAAEIAIVKYAHWIAEQGYSVFVRNETYACDVDGGVVYGNLPQEMARCRALVISRYSRIPQNIQADRTIIWSVDADPHCHDHQKHLFEQKLATLVCISPWHATLFPRSWPIRVIPSALPDATYLPNPGENAGVGQIKRDPHLFVYCSAALKGLVATLGYWKMLKHKYPELAKARLVVTTPGYDKPDVAMIEDAGAEYIGDLPPDGVERLLRTAAGLFFVNTFPETFCLAAVLAESVGCRCHILLGKVHGAIPWSVRSPHVTQDPVLFERDFIEAYRSPSLYPVVRPNDFRMSKVMPEWLDVLELKPIHVRQYAFKTICLTMIVSEKTSLESLKRCVDSMRMYLACGSCVVDKESKIHDRIKEAFGQLPVKIFEEPWVGFGHNRTLAIEHARGMAEYDLMVDADDFLEFEPWFEMPWLNRDHYDIQFVESIEYWRPLLFRNNSDYYFEGAAHEFLTHRTPKRLAPRLHGILYRRTGVGSDAVRHEWAVKSLAHNPRNAFYFANELKDSGRIREALHAYEVRACLTDGFGEEVFQSLLESARCHVKLGDPPTVVEVAYVVAYEREPKRGPEVMAELAWYLMERKQWEKAYQYARKAIGITYPTEEMLFMQRAPYEWKLKDALAIASYYVGKFGESKELNEQMLASGLLPIEERPRVESNLAFAIAAIVEKA